MTNNTTAPIVVPLVVFLLLTVISHALVVPSSYLYATTKAQQQRSSTQLFVKKSPRDERADEIRRKILTLKRLGKIKKKTSSHDDDDEDDKDSNPSEQLSDLEQLKRSRKKLQRSSAAEDYASKLTKKRTRAAYLGYSASDDDDDDDDEIMSSSSTKSSSEEKQQKEEEPEQESTKPRRRKGQLGSLAKKKSPPKEEEGEENKNDKKEKEINILDPALQGVVSEDEVDDNMEEEDLVDLVAQKLREKRQRQDKERNERLRKMAQETRQMQQEAENRGELITTGVGGNYVKNGTAEKDTYKPSKSGSWGVFERPKDISRAYGGGRRIGVGYSNEQELVKSTEGTRKLLKDYLKKAGIEVQSEKDHGDEIKIALAIASKAMDRGRYDTGISALEKVTKWCSTNSETGGKVFLELAMAYEAANRKDEAVAVYKELTTCRIVDIKVHAKRLLYGIEAIDFMRDEAGSKDFGPYGQRAGSDNDLSKYLSQKLASVNRDYFPDLVYAPYVDVNKRRSGRGRRLSTMIMEAVDGPKEAFEILNRAITKGGEARSKLIESLRILSSAFDTALEQERKAEKLKNEIAVMNGKPISSYVVSSRQEPSKKEKEFKLTSPERMVERMDGEWKLQFTADKVMDGSVQFFNDTSKVATWQELDSIISRFKSGGPLVGFMTYEEYGALDFNTTERILTRQPRFRSNGFASKMFPNVGASSSLVPQQIMSVDKRMLITRCSKDCEVRPNDETKDYYAVWSRVKRGTYSKKTRILQ